MQNEDTLPQTFAAKPLDQGDIDAAFIAMRAHADKSIYGKYMSDDECRAAVMDIITAINNYRAGTAP